MIKHPPLFLLLLAAFVNGNDGILKPPSRQVEGLTGDSVCDEVMCVTATVNGPLTEYVLQSTGVLPLGWMAVGFGRIMAHTPMVIMWPNEDNSVTLSQRTAPRERMPTVDPNPPRWSNLSMTSTYLDGDLSKLAFTIPSITADEQDIIYAFCSKRPSSSAVDERIQFHDRYGRGKLNLAKPVKDEEESVEIPEEGVTDMVLQPYQRSIIAHAIFCIVGFLITLPAGALVARYLRTFSPKWFHVHWVLQSIFGGTTILIGIFLGYRSVHKAGGIHYNDAHKAYFFCFTFSEYILTSSIQKWGVALCVLYFLQCIFGAVVHRAVRAKRIGGVFHATFGLMTIALSMYQVRLGYKYEWPATTGRGIIKPIENLWLTLVIVLPIMYGAGLLLLPRQFAQARSKISAFDADKIAMESRPLQATEDDDD